MAHSKQTARKSGRYKAPGKQLAAKAALGGVKKPHRLAECLPFTLDYSGVKSEETLHQITKQGPSLGPNTENVFAKENDAAAKNLHTIKKKTYHRDRAQGWQKDCGDRDCRNTSRWNYCFK